jgi:cbb3-type cytochrome oxidase subunit 1
MPERRATTCVLLVVIVVVNFFAQIKRKQKNTKKLVRWYLLSTFFLFYLIRAISRSIQLPFTRCAHPPLSYFSFSCCTYNSGDPNVSVACVGNVQIF